MVHDAGIDHLFVADHVTFRDGRGMDGLIQAAGLLALHPELAAYVGVYLLALRHPVVVARQIASIAEVAPGRLTFGVGVGGEDRNEFVACGVDPATRGRRTDEALVILRSLLTGQPVTQRGEFFAIDDVRIRPAPDPAVPIVIGGRSQAALRRTAELGDGWLAAWCSAEAFATNLAAIDGLAAAAGRPNVEWQHGYQNWIGVDRDRPAALQRLAPAMEAFYGVPFAAFERYAPAGSPSEIADYLGPFAAAGCRPSICIPSPETWRLASPRWERSSGGWPEREAAGGDVRCANIAAMREWDIAIIGGGIVGLATALALARHHYETSVVVLEKEHELATHQTGHNSGVVHAGLYYTPGSLKAQLCVAGGRRLVEFCGEHGIPVGRCGKVVVAVDDDQLDALAELERRATANGVPTERIDAAGIAAREPQVVGVAGLWVPETSVVDFAQVAAVYAGLAAEGNCQIRTGFEVVDAAPTAKGWRIESPTGWVNARVVINCAGLHVDRIARMMGTDPGVQIVPFRGEYYEIVPQRAHLVNGLVYPVPDPRFPFLGVHFTRDVHGRVEVGPNAVLAMAREGYRRSDIRWGDLAEALRYRGLLALGRTYWRTGAAEMWRSAVKSAFVRDANRLIPALTPDDLGAYRSGIRAQALRPDGSMLHDFAIEETDGAIHVLNAPSPAATASLAIGEHIATIAGSQLA